MRAIVGIISRVIFWITAVYLVGAEALALVAQNNYVYAVLAVVFFPITYFLSAFYLGLWWLLLISIVAYIISTTIGKMEPVD